MSRESLEQVGRLGGWFSRPFPFLRSALSEPSNEYLFGARALARGSAAPLLGRDGVRRRGRSDGAGGSRGDLVYGALQDESSRERDAENELWRAAATMDALHAYSPWYCPSLGCIKMFTVWSGPIWVVLPLHVAQLIIWAYLGFDAVTVYQGYEEAVFKNHSIWLVILALVNIMPWVTMTAGLWAMQEHRMGHLFRRVTVLGSLSPLWRRRIKREVQKTAIAVAVVVIATIPIELVIARHASSSIDVGYGKYTTLINHLSFIDAFKFAAPVVHASLLHLFCQTPVWEMENLVDCVVGADRAKFEKQMAVSPFTAAVRRAHARVRATTWAVACLGEVPPPAERELGELPTHAPFAGGDDAIVRVPREAFIERVLTVPRPPAADELPALGRATRGACFGCCRADDAASDDCYAAAPLRLDHVVRIRAQVTRTHAAHAQATADAIAGVRAPEPESAAALTDAAGYHPPPPCGSAGQEDAKAPDHVDSHGSGIETVVINDGVARAASSAAVPAGSTPTPTGSASTAGAADVEAVPVTPAGAAAEPVAGAPATQGLAERAGEGEPEGEYHGEGEQQPLTFEQFRVAYIRVMHYYEVNARVYSGWIVAVTLLASGLCVAVGAFLLFEGGVSSVMASYGSPVKLSWLGFVHFMEEVMVMVGSFGYVLHGLALVPKAQEAALHRLSRDMRGDTAAEKEERNAFREFLLEQRKKPPITVFGVVVSHRLVLRGLYVVLVTGVFEAARVLQGLLPSGAVL